MTRLDVLLLGATGQVGRTLLRRLAGRAEIAVVMRRETQDAARAELRALLGRPAERITVVLGDALSAELPAARDVIHTAGRSQFLGTYDEYVAANVLSTVRLAHHAKATGAHLHLLSSVMVAMSRSLPMAETEAATPDPGQTRYALSKCLAELAAERIHDGVSVYRMSDAVPDPTFLDTDVRADHWLTLLLGTGGVRHCRPDSPRGFWAIPGDQLADALTQLIARRTPGRFHLLGTEYRLGGLREAIADRAAEAYPFPRLGTRLARLADRDFALPAVDDRATVRALAESGMRWRPLDDGYWRRYAAAAVRAVDRAATTAAGLTRPAMWWGAPTLADEWALRPVGAVR